MSREHETEPGTPLEDRRSLDRLADRLRSGRPRPDAAFRGELRRRLSAQSELRGASRGHRMVALGYAGLGAVCLGVAVAGLLGVGPFAA